MGFKKRSPDWFKRRTYLHFDLPINREAATKLVTNPARVKAHAFYPMISFDINSTKIKWDKKKNKLVSTPKTRTIRYAAHLDSHIYSYYCEYVSELYEKYLKECSYEGSVLAFRKLGKSNIDFAFDAFSAIKEIGNADAIALDISDFFGSLDHGIIKASWAKLLGLTELPPDHYNIFKSLTRYAYVDRDAVYGRFKISAHNPKANRKRICEPDDFRYVVRTGGLISRNKSSKGIPQGSPISALLSNIYMMDFDLAMSEAVGMVGGKYFRYCDDMLLIVPAGRGSAMKSLAETQIKLFGLEVQPKKTEERTFTKSGGAITSNRPLQYLGFLFDGQRILLRSSSLARYSERMRRGVRLAKATARSRNAKRLERGEVAIPLRLRKIYKRYSYLGRRNFISYAIKAALVLDADGIRKQIKPHWKRLAAELKPGP
ncbi:Reverse transcriptase (RNA-dependent DNA polymerase) [Cupriavidus oxalaticus]|uniref:antiviral reverse transcriptase Drt2 n=1 Tax=Cupriavidus oxalaticus TaxID=96344 RepID=UPI003F73C39B